MHFCRQITPQRSHVAQDKDFHTVMQLGPLCRGASQEPVTWEDAWKRPEERKVWWEEGDRMSLACHCP